jgi:hypothetical protein
VESLPSLSEEKKKADANTSQETPLFAKEMERLQGLQWENESKRKRKEKQSMMVVVTKKSPNPKQLQQEMRRRLH